jgi:hypothetical protein
LTSFYERFNQLKQDLTSYHGENQINKLLNLCTPSSDSSYSAAPLQPTLLPTLLPLFRSTTTTLRLLQINTFIGFRHGARYQMFSDW